MTDSMFALWTWPLTAARLVSDTAEMTLGAQRVVAARLPTIGAAVSNPFSADHAELGLMVSEKVAAFGKSRKSFGSAGEVVRDASVANARAMGRLAGGNPLWPTDWMRLAEANLAAAAAMVSLPAAAMAPLQRGVKANDRRLAN